MSGCPWCKKFEAIALGVRPDGIMIYQCRLCGLIFREGNEVTADYYTAEYFQNQPGHKEKSTLRLQLVLYLTGGLKRFNRILDIGCGAGYFLEQIGRISSNVYGLDSSPAAVALCRAKGLTVHQGRMETFHSETRFDFVTAWEVIEHVEDLQSFLSSIKRVLADDGMLIVSTPNAGSYRARQSGLSWPGFIWSPEHLSYFTVSALNNILEKVFMPCRVRFIEFDWRSEDTLVAIVQKGKAEESIVKGPRRVLFVGRTNGLEVPGGDMTQLFSTRAALEERGVAVDVSLSALPSLNLNYDLIHQFGLPNAEAVDQLYHLRDHHKRTLLSPIYWNLEEAKAATEEVAAIVEKEKETAKVIEALQLYGVGKIKVEGIRTYRSPYERLKEERRELLTGLAHFLPNSYAEMQELRKDFGLWQATYTVVPNAVDPALVLNATPEWFVNKYGVKDFVLCAARLEPRKNQLMLLLALHGTGLPCVIIGRPQVPEYAELCRRYAPSNTLFIDHLPQEFLASAYAAARVHALVSWSETPGLSSLEAALAGCSIVVSDRGSAWEYFGDMAYYCNPRRLDSIQEAVYRAWHDYSPERQAALRETILRRYTWERAAQRTLEAYEEVMSRHDLNQEVRVIVAEGRTHSLRSKLGKVGRVAIFGASLTGRECYRAALEEGVEVKFFLDNSPARQGTLFLGLPVYAVDYIMGPGAEEVDAVVLASAGYQDQMAQQLWQMGWRKMIVRP